MQSNHDQLRRKDDTLNFVQKQTLSFEMLDIPSKYFAFENYDTESGTPAINVTIGFIGILLIDRTLNILEYYRPISVIHPT